jgi:hypothetical protein
MTEDWELSHSIHCHVPRAFAWAYWSNVSNWAFDADIERVVIDGPFEAGSQGATISKTSGHISWRLAEVVQESRATVEFPLPGAAGIFRWLFEEAEGGTRITQRVTIEGEQAASMVAAFGSTLQTALPAGMKKLAEQIEMAAAR